MNKIFAQGMAQAKFDVAMDLEYILNNDFKKETLEEYIKHLLRQVERIDNLYNKEE